MSGHILYADHRGRKIRLTDERRDHILEHPEMATQIDRIGETLTSPERIIATHLDENVHVYHRYYDKTPVTSKYLHVAVKITPDDAFIVTAYFSNRIKRGVEIWPE